MHCTSVIGRETATFALAQNTQHSPCLFSGKEIEDKIHNCELNPSGITKTEVDAVFQTILGRCSQTWVDSLKAQDVVLEKAMEHSRAYEILVFLSQGMIAPSEMALYPYAHNFYLAGKVLCCLHHLSSTISCFTYNTCTASLGIQLQHACTYDIEVPLYWVADCMALTLHALLMWPLCLCA